MKEVGVPPLRSGESCKTDLPAEAHTPGPWEVEFSTITGRPLGIYAPNDANIPGAVGSIVRRNGIGLPSSAKAVANARLIAAAPDLLDFAQSMVVALDLAAELFPADAIHFQQFAEDARAVIGKATLQAES